MQCFVNRCTTIDRSTSVTLIVLQQSTLSICVATVGSAMTLLDSQASVYLWLTALLCICVLTSVLRCVALCCHTTLQLVKDTLRSNIAIDAMRIMLKLSSPSESTSSDDFSKAIDAKEVCVMYSLHNIVYKTMHAGVHYCALLRYAYTLTCTHGVHSALWRSCSYIQSFVKSLCSLTYTYA
jgi:hypothetical protein